MTRASADGARWRGRLDGGKVSGFGRLPPRKKVPVDGVLDGMEGWSEGYDDEEDE